MYVFTEWALLYVGHYDEFFIIGYTKRAAINENFADR